MKIGVVIPARMASTRFPGKPLAPILGLPMIEHVRRRASLCSQVDQVVVATCDEDIRKVVELAGGRVAMTSPGHERCTDRVVEAVRTMDVDIVVNLQGDEPLILPDMIAQVVAPLRENAELVCTNLMTRIHDPAEFEDPNAVKVVVNNAGDMLYCSREPIPSRRKSENQNFVKWKQIGVIAFRKNFLELFSNLEPTPLEIIESVDMMRAVEHGWRVRMVETEGSTVGVDVPEDIARAEQALAGDPFLSKYMDSGVLR